MSLCEFIALLFQNRCEVANCQIFHHNEVNEMQS
jgi:hypothetical protein